MIIKIKGNKAPEGEDPEETIKKLKFLPMQLLKQKTHKKTDGKLNGKN